MIRILIADDHALIRDGLTQLLAGQGDFEIVGAARNGREAVEMAARLEPDVVLMDLAMPELTGIGAIRQIKMRRAATVVVALTTFGEPDRVLAAFQAGADGFFMKDVEAEVLIAGLRSTASGGIPLSPSVAAQLLRKPKSVEVGVASLTSREADVLTLIAEGFKNKQIARQLGISEKTVKAHCGRLFQRIGVTDRTQAAVWATKHYPRDATA